MTDSDDMVREVHGMSARDNDTHAIRVVTVREGERGIVLMRPNADIALTSQQARYLAAKLYRLARRIKNRTQEPQP